MGEFPSTDGGFSGVEVRIEAFGGLVGITNRMVVAFL